MTPVSAAAFGANGGLGRGDDPQDAHLAIDGQRGTAWHTDWYTSPRFGNLYSGTGLVVDMGRPVTVTAVQGPWAQAPGSTSRSALAISRTWRPWRRWRLRRPGGVDPDDAGPSTPTGRYVMVWFTKLPPDPAGTYQAEIYGISVKGRP